MSEPWTFAQSSDPPSNEATLSLIEGSTFCISDTNGDISAARVHGLFVRDTRVLSHWELTVDGSHPSPLATHRPDPYAAETLGWLLPPGQEATPGHLLVVRRRYVGEGLREDLTLQNHAPREVRCRIVLTADADFADVFEVKDGHVVPGPPVTYDTSGPGVLSILGQRAGRRFGVRIHADRDPVVTGASLEFVAVVPSRGTWTTSIEVAPVIGQQALEPRHPRGQAVDRSTPALNLSSWRRRSPTVSTGNADLAAVLSRSIEDLGSLRIFDPEHPDWAIVAAGAPWFMAVFGRDSLLTSLMVLPIDAGLAVGTLRILAAHQGQQRNPTTEEEPGRILHEMRFGPSATLALGGGSVYYGTADATALFIILLGQLDRWGTHPDEVVPLIPHAERAGAWIDGDGDADRDGFVEYARATESGLLNQGWKDSWDGVNFADGRLAQGPIALAEVQAYGYAALRSLAALVERHGGQRDAAHYLARADRLKRDFNDRFWLPERGWYAVALDGDKAQVDALTSNIGHCLWTGIVDDDKAEQVARHLLSPEMFTGWGIRTLATTMGAYDPMSYHNGSVWPHDNAICAAGLMRYGFVDAAQQVAAGILEAAPHFGNRLPELFCGFSREEFHQPVSYPTSCSPQAWASAAPIDLLRTLLRFRPESVSGRASAVPAVPPAYLPLHVEDLQVGTRHYTIDVDRSGWALATTDGDVIQGSGVVQPLP